MQIGPLQRRCLNSTQPAVIQGPEQRVVPASGRVLAGGRDPFPQERKELSHPLRGRRRPRRRRVVADMSACVELIDRILQHHPEGRLDLRSLASHQEPMEVLERLHIPPPSRRRRTPGHQLSNNTVVVVGPGLPRRHRQQIQEPLQHTHAVLDRHRAEPPRCPRRHETIHAHRLERLIVQFARRRCRRPADDPQTKPAHNTPSSRHTNEGGT